MPLIKISPKTALRLNDLYTGFCELSNDMTYSPCVFIDIYGNLTIKCKKFYIFSRHIGFIF